MVKKENSKTITNCVHIWIIDTANGKESKGRCSKCKEQRVFLNSLESQDIKCGWGHQIIT